MSRSAEAVAADDAREGVVVTRAVLRAADILKVSNAVLGEILGLSGSTISRMRQGQHVLKPGDKSFELGLFLIRLYRGLDSISSSQDGYSRDWLTSFNRALGDVPLKKIRTVRGLVDVVDYIDAHRAVV